jgi:hypothetical protein
MWVNRRSRSRSTCEEKLQRSFAGEPAFAAQCDVAVGLTAHDLVLVGVAAGAGAGVCVHSCPLTSKDPTCASVHVEGKPLQCDECRCRPVPSDLHRPEIPGEYLMLALSPADQGVSHTQGREPREVTIRGEELANSVIKTEGSDLRVVKCAAGRSSVHCERSQRL